MTISTGELTGMAEGRHVFGHKDGLALATELLAARAKIETLQEKLTIAMMFSPPIRACKSCGSPKADGYVCDCGAQE